MYWHLFKDKLLQELYWSKRCSFSLLLFILLLNYQKVCSRTVHSLSFNSRLLKMVSYTLELKYFVLDLFKTNIAALAESLKQWFILCRSLGWTFWYLVTPKMLYSLFLFLNPSSTLFFRCFCYYCCFVLWCFCLRLKVLFICTYYVSGCRLKLWKHFRKK